MTVKRLQQGEAAAPAEGQDRGGDGEMEALIQVLGEVLPAPEASRQHRQRGDCALHLQPGVRVPAVRLLALLRKAGHHLPTVRARLLPPTARLLPAPKVLATVRTGPG